MPDPTKINVLFVCNRNQWRSATGEQMWRNHANLWVRSAGTSPSAKRTVNKGGILWADVIFVMEEKHKCRLRAQFTQLLLYIDIQVLDIPDDYQFMDGALVEILKATVGAYLKLDTCY